MSIRIVLVDDHGVIRAGLKSLLKATPDIEVVGDVGDGAGAMQLATELDPDVMLLDIGMPGEDGIEVARKLKARLPRIRLLFLTMHEDESLLREAIAVGASGYVLKRADEAEIITAIRAAARGDLYVHPSMTRVLLRTAADDGAPHEAPGLPEVEALTPRELDILRFLARGYTNRQIAEDLGLSVRTVEGHRANLMGKLGVSSRVELVTYAEAKGLI